MNNDIMTRIVDVIKQNKTFAIIPHINPDADALGSCYGVAHTLEKMGKRADIYLQEDLPKNLEFLAEEYCIFDGNAKKYDVCMCIDCGDIVRVDKRKAIMDLSEISINIDHHYKNTKYADINLVDASASSAGEICTELVKKLDANIDTDIAKCLYSAICADTGGFKYSNTTPKTMRIAADLLEVGISPDKICKNLFDTESFAAVSIKGEIAKNARLYNDGLIGVVKLTEQMCKKYGIDAKDVDNFVDIVRRVEGVELAISLKETDKGIKISLRSNEYADVSKIAEQFGGGGHIRASGAVINDTIENAEKTIVDSAIKIMKECGK